MVIQTNITGVHTMHENIKIRGSVSKTVEKLSSGFRINRAADDAAGLGVSETMREQITELARAQRNVQEGIDVTNTADGALAEINSMLRRARELCIEGANGIYTQPELDAISDELNEIFDDIDRITAGTRHNDIQLFRYKGSNIGTRYDYNDFYTEVSPDKLVVWGEMDFVQSTEFDEPTPATPATATFTLDKSIDVNDAMTMDGKTLKIGNTTYRFDGGGYNFPPADYYDQTISIRKGETVQQVLDRLKEASFHYGSGYHLLKDIKLDGNTVTLTAPLTTLTESVTSDIGTSNTVDPDGNGEFANNIPITSEEGQSIMQVDGDNVKNNPITYGTTATYTRKLPTTLTADDISNLSQNTFHAGNVSFSLGSIGLQAGDTQDQIGNKLVAAINGKGNVTATYQNGELKITINNLSSTGPSTASVYEQNKYTQTSPSQPGPTLSAAGLNITATKTQAASPESQEIWTVTIPSQTPPFSFSCNGSTYVFYDSSSGKFPPDGFRLNYSVNLIDTKNMSPADITKNVYNRLYVSGANKSELNGNTVTFKAGPLNQPIHPNISGSSVNVTSYKPEEGKTTSCILFPSQYSPGYCTQEASVEFDLGSDISKLTGKGFGYVAYGGSSSVRNFEFVNGAGTGIQSGYNDIDISGCATLEDVRVAMETQIQKVLGKNYTVALSGTKVTITGTRIAYAYNPAAVTDGYHDTDGIFTSQGDKDLTKNFSGGKNSNHSQTVIDFSSINDSNLETLLGKGFRINCATCKGEYINVFFCWENNGEAPESFVDPVSRRTIHNIAVELSKVSNGEKIVEDIVNQVSPQLKHFTGVAVGNPPTQLIAYEKRLGDSKEVGGIGSVETGVYTNFEYSYEKVEIKDTPPAVGDGGLAADFRKMLIYVGSEPDHQWIPIHLPWLDLPTLGLQPPDAVDLGGGEDPFDWLKRVDAANGVITTSRSRIGADYNRLEHTFSALTQTRENMEDAESRIRDADMAKLMVQYMKDQIIGQAQQSMMLHSNDRPQQILELLR